MDEYKLFIFEEQFDGTLGDLFEEIIEAFVNEEIGQSKLGEFHSMAGIVKIDDCGDFIFNEGLQGLERGYILEEDVIRETVVRKLLHGIKKSNMEFDIDGRLKVIPTVMLDVKIKATYTLAYS